jgi:hypothetical protein
MPVNFAVGFKLLLKVTVEFFCTLKSCNKRQMWMIQSKAYQFYTTQKQLIRRLYLEILIIIGDSVHIRDASKLLRADICCNNSKRFRELKTTMDLHTCS